MATQIGSKMLSDFYFLEGDDWHSLPGWGRFFVRMGGLIAEEDRDRRLIIGVSVPTRAYSAALTALGVIIARSTMQVDRYDPEDHFKKLCSLSIGTPLLYLRENKKLKGIFKGSEIISGQSFIKIQIEKDLVDGAKAGGGTIFVQTHDAHKVSLLKVEEIKLPKKQKGYLIVPHEKFLRTILGENNVYDFALNTRLECAVIGRIGQFRNEVKQTSFSIRPPGSSPATGTLQDFLRVRQFLNIGAHYRSEVLKAIGKNAPKATDGLKAHTVIFDGTAGFIRWRDHFQESNWVVILDRTESYFQEAVNFLNLGFHKNKIAEELVKCMPSVPAGIEFVAYTEK